MIIVTGGAGFIGSNLIKELNNKGIEDIFVVDNLKNGYKFYNLVDLKFNDYIDKNEFIDLLETTNRFKNCEALFHLGACSTTTEWDGSYLMKNNYEYSKKLLNWSQENKIKFIYASSASVYGLGVNGFLEDINCEKPINMYAYSKYIFDNYVRRHFGDFNSQVVGLRYFNVYGPREQHKTNMSSPILKFHDQLKKSGTCKLFKGSHGYQDGDHLRDFIYINDCIDVKFWFYKNSKFSGIFNVGSSVTTSFNEVAKAVIDFNSLKYKKDFKIEYIDFPSNLYDSYQYYTCADLRKLRKTGFEKEFTNIKEGVFDYLSQID